MQPSARSIHIFGIYIALLGLVLLCAPNVLLGLVGLEPTHEPWIRVLGVIAVGLGYFYLTAARHGEKPLFRASVYGRVWVFLAFIALVLLGLARPILIAFGAVDLAGAIWTWMALRGEGRT